MLTFEQVIGCIIGRVYESCIIGSVCGNIGFAHNSAHFTNIGPMPMNSKAVLTN